MPGKGNREVWGGVIVRRRVVACVVSGGGFSSCGEFGRWSGRGQDDLWLNLAAVLENSGS
jgi:hypothetical protein